MVFRSKSLLVMFGLVSISFVAVTAAPPELPDGTDTAIKRMAAFSIPNGMKVELFAAEPMLASPVAIGLDEFNRVFVAEEYRFNLGTEENRTRPFLLEDDLQIQTVEDRLKMYEKFAKNFDGGMEWFRKVADQVRLVQDTDGDGKADRSTIFAPGFNGILDGLAAGVMAKDGDVYFTCIPNLWRLRDNDGDGIADERTVIHSGFGVNAGFLGHDLHGLCWGPDGKLYFSIGDRGFHLTTQEGSILHGPRNGAVFRCFPNGSELEVVCRGLRNPQELAFDQFGNLFADDNNCDKGDHSRLVYCLEGSDSGWNMAFQSIPEPYLTGPWHAEKMWHLWAGESSAASADRPAWVLPPVGKLGAGPSGFTYYPGTGLPQRYDHHFFMCNYTGNGGIESFSIKPHGAGFEIIDEHDFMKPISATDCEFGYDGKLYVSDFVNLLWNGGSAGGRIYTVFDTRHINDPAVKSTTQLVRDGFKQLNSEKLTELLAHADQRIRQRAQFELAARGADSIPVLQATLATSRHRLARSHALWGLGQLAGRPNAAEARTPDDRVRACAAIMSCITDEDAEIRGWSVKLLGDHRYQPSAEIIVKRLTDKSPRVQLFAAMAVGKLHFEAMPSELVALIRDNNGADPWLQHGCVMALAGLADRDPVRWLEPLFSDKNPSVRMAGLLALRQIEKQSTEWVVHPSIEDSTVEVTKTYSGTIMQRLLHDEDLRIVTDAARAINDLPIEAGYAALAALTPALKGTSAATIPEALSRRVINANFRLGSVENAQNVLSLVVEPALSLTIRKQAIDALIDWDQPSPRDRVTGFWGPIHPRKPENLPKLKSFLTESVATLLGQATGELQPDVVRLISRYNIPTDDTVFAKWIDDRGKSPASQTAALRLLATRKSPLAEAAIDSALKNGQPGVRAEARDMLALLNPVEAISVLEPTLNSDSAPILERQRAIATLATIKLPSSDAILQGWISKLNLGQVPDFLELDVLDAATARDLPELKQAADQFRAKLGSGDLMTRNRISSNGGDADRGREIFVGHRVGQCLRCHKVGTTLQGGTAGPDLNQVGVRHDRTSLLQSLIDPSAKIAKGFESLTLVMHDGRIIGGTIRKEDAGEIVLEKPEGGQVTIKTADVEERSAPKSAMPEMNRALTPRELRDLVEFLSQLK